MPELPNMAEMARLATENYRHIESLEQIKPPYPERGTPNWWSLRLRYEEILFVRVRRLRKGECLANEPELHAAKWTALGNEVAARAYEKAARGGD